MVRYLIDYENTRENAFSFGDNNFSLKQGDVVYIIYTNNTNRVNLDFIEKILRAKVKIQIEKVAAGKQSLDMHLSSLLGFLIASDFAKRESNEETKYVVLSGDGDYDGVIKFWKSKNVNVSRIAPVTAQPVKSPSPSVLPPAPPVLSSNKKKEEDNKKKEKETKQKKKEHTALNAQITKIFAKNKVECKLSGSLASLAIKNIDDKDNPKLKIYQEFVKHCGQKNGCKYYNMIKSVL